MKKAILILLGMTLSICVKAQAPDRQRELGISFVNLNNFGLTYRTGTETAVWRFNALLLLGEISSQLPPEENFERKMGNLGFGLSIGREGRSTLAENLEGRFGLDFSFNYWHAWNNRYAEAPRGNIRREIFSVYEPGVNLVFGLNFKLGDHIVIGAEILPGVSYFLEVDEVHIGPRDIQVTERQRQSEFRFGLSSSTAAITVLYRF